MINYNLLLLEWHSPLLFYLTCFLIYWDILRFWDDYVWKARIRNSFCI